MVTRRALLLEFAVLGLLHDGPTHGYDLRRRLNLALGPFRALSFGTLYPALRSLLAQGFIAEVGTTAIRTAGGTPSKRPRIVYDLTADGREHFEALAAQADAAAYDDDAFDVRLHFFARTTAEVRLRILEGRRTKLQEHLDRLRASAVQARERMDTWSAAQQRHGEETTEREVRWLTELIDAERRNLFDPGPPGPRPQH